MRKKDAKRTRNGGVSEKTIADLFRAIEDLVSGHKKPEELEGIIADARELAREWKDPYSAQRPKDRRSLFGEIERNTTLLLAALVVALREGHDLLERIRRRFPNELEALIDMVLHAECMELGERLASAQPPPKSWQKFERNKRRRWHRSHLNSIEYQFGGGREADLRKRLHSLFRPDDSSYNAVLTSQQTCLDGIFAGDSVNMQALEDLFYGIERHRLAKLAKRTGIQIKPGRSSRFDYSAVHGIMDALLKEKPHSKYKKKVGRPPAPPWLNGADLRNRVRRAIGARIQMIDNLLLSIVANEVDVSQLSDEDLRLVRTIFEHFRGYREWKTRIAKPFLSVVRRHLPDSGKK